MKKQDNINGLFDFIENSPNAFHAVNTVKERLFADGYTEVFEGDEWALCEGGKYFVTRNGSSLIAFRYHNGANGFVITASHTDSPAFRVKISEESDGGAYLRLPVEKYGGIILYSWFDRPLSIAGRVMVREGDNIRARLLDIPRPLINIPSVAIHFNRTVNDKFSPNLAQDVVSLLSVGKDKTLRELIAEELSVNVEDIIAHDLFLYVKERGVRFGINNELLMIPRLDDLACVYSSLEAFLAAKENGMIPVFAAFDNEEVGSDTKQGAASTFLADTLCAIVGLQAYRKALANSFMVSADNAHAKHPNHPELSDPDNAPTLNGGIVVKYNASQKYTTDAASAALFYEVCRKEGVKVQNYYTRADMPGGSTLGSIATTKVSVSTVDIGIPQLAMHSAVETAGVSDVCDMISALTRLYSTGIEIKNDKIITK